MHRKFRHDNAFKFFYRDAETALSFSVLPSAWVWRECQGARPLGVISCAVGLVCPDYLGPLEAPVSPEPDQMWRLQSATSQ
jgi:hypothetical protein